MKEPSLRPKENWGTRLGVILAVAGSAIGLGNYLRFPGLAAQYGGGVFLIPYFTAFLLLGLPLAWSEWALGRYGGRHGYNSVPGIFFHVWKNPFAPYLGLLGVLMPMTIYMYYVYIEAWCFTYAMRYLLGMMSPTALGVTPDMVHGYLMAHPDLLYDYIRNSLCAWELQQLIGDPVLLHDVLCGKVQSLITAVQASPDSFSAFLTTNHESINQYINGQPVLKNSIYYNIFFNNFTGVHENGEAFSGLFRYGFFGSSLFAIVFCFALNFWIIFNGISKGIERFCLIAMPALFFCSFIILFRVLTLGTPNPDLPEQSIINGLGYMWNPVKPGAEFAGPEHSFFGALMNPEMWMAAAGQVFFSLSVGFGLVMTYASYMRKNDDVALSCLTASSANSFCEVVLGGLITIPAAFVFLGETYLKGSLNSTFDLGFKVLPNVFGQMYMGQFFGFLFFALLFLAAVTSTVSMLQPAIALFDEGLKLKRKDSVALLAFICFLGTVFVVYFSANLNALDNLDFWMANVFIFMLATIQSLVFAFVLGTKKGMEEIRRGAEIKVPQILEFVLKYITPSYLLIIFICWIYMNLSSRIKQILTDPVAFYAVVVILTLFMLLIYITSRAVQNWKRQETMHTESIDNNTDITG